MRIEKRIVEEEIYIALDGKEFKDKELCELHEKMVGWGDIWEAVEELRLHELDGYMPLGCEEYETYGTSFRWYKVNNKEDFHKVYLAHKLTGNFDDLSEIIYPEVLCVEVECSVNRTYTTLHIPREGIKAVKGYLEVINKYLDDNSADRLVLVEDGTITTYDFDDNQMSRVVEGFEEIGGYKEDDLNFEGYNCFINKRDVNGLYVLDSNGTVLEKFSKFKD